MLQAGHSDPDGLLLLRVDGSFDVCAHFSQVATLHHGGEEVRVLLLKLAEVVEAVLGSLAA